MIIDTVKVVSWFFIAGSMLRAVLKYFAPDSVLIEYGIRSRNIDPDAKIIVTLAVVLILVEILEELRKLNAKIKDRIEEANE